MRLGTPQGDEQVLPPLRITPITTAGEDCLLTNPYGASNRSGTLSPGGGAAQGIYPTSNLINQILIWLSTDGPTPERHGNIVSTMSLDVTVAVKRRDSTGKTQPRDSAAEVDGAARAPAPDLASSFGNKTTQFCECCRALPEREPLLTAVLLPIY